MATGPDACNPPHQSGSSGLRQRRGIPATPEARYGPMTRAEQMRYCARMDWPDYLRDQAAKYRQLAEQTDDPVIKVELLELASVCEEVASNIEDHLTGG